MYNIRLVFAFSCCFLFVGCGAKNPVPTIPDKKPNYQPQIFTQPVTGSTITLVSDTECEIETGHGILLAEYSRQSNKLRVVVRVSGTASVLYYQITDDGLISADSNEAYLLPGPLAKFREEMRIAQEKEAARARAVHEAAAAQALAKKTEQARLRRIEEERIQLKKNEVHEKSIALRDKGIADVREFFTNGAVIKAYYIPHYDGTTNPFEVNVTGKVTFVDDKKDPYDQYFNVSGHLKWLGEPGRPRDFVNRKERTFSYIKEMDGLFIGKVIVVRNGDDRRLDIVVQFSGPDSFNDYYNSHRAYADDSRWNGIEFAKGKLSSNRFYRE